jgi:anti-sigma regulatory factor (Ser/Thr protein kinase)
MHYHYEISGEDFTLAGEASSDIKTKLKAMGVSPDIIRKTAIAMYEGEINLFIHAHGGQIDVTMTPDGITIDFTDHGPGIEDIDLAMQAGYSTASQKVRELGFGAGMGLPNMKENSDEMSIQSTVGVGTQVHLFIHF